MVKEVRDELRIMFKMRILEFAQLYGDPSEACREFEVPRSTFYVWKKAFDAKGTYVLDTYESGSGQEETDRTKPSKACLTRGH